jgi:primosomal protein N' (replication factor Y)
MWVEVILPVPVHSTFTYFWNESLKPTPGLRVHVSFGRQNCLMGVIQKIQENRPDFDCKPILRVLDDYPRIQIQQINLWNWISDYYLCPIGEVMQSALPAFFKLKESDSGPYTLGDGSVAHFRWYAKKSDSGKISEVFSQLNRAKLQSEALLSYFQICSNQLDMDSEYYPWISQDLLLEYSSVKAVQLNALKEKGFLKKSMRHSLIEAISEGEKIDLSDSQLDAFSSIKKGFSMGKPVLLKGETGSGKTEIYLKLADDILKSGKHVLLLVPEIALTAQLYKRIEKSLGRDLVSVYHSQASESERRDVWQSLLNPETAPRLILAARSGIFLPLNHVGLIVVDEEHETSYKQYEPSPRYHARDVAVWISKKIKCDIVLGSATPSIESYHNANQLKYFKVELKERFGSSKPPKIEMLSLIKYKSMKMMKGPLSLPATELIERVLAKNQQALVFQNRRGYSPYLTCMSCGWTEPCSECDVAVTFHKESKLLKCHYCGNSRKPPKKCPSCQGSGWKLRGIGTERVEENLDEIFPDANILRIDSDSARKKKSMSHFIEWLETGKVDILVGTQMIGKGIDISGLSIAIILDADNALQMPDFRSHERAFQLFSQVAGRTGRRQNQGHVIIQTVAPEHPVLLAVQKGAYDIMAKSILEDRRHYHYPPFVKMVKIELRHSKEVIVEDAAKFLAEKLVRSFRGGVLGPEKPAVSRIKNFHLQHIWMKFQNGKSLPVMKEKLRKINNSIYFSSDFRSVKIHIDVDPY